MERSRGSKGRAVLFWGRSYEGRMKERTFLMSGSAWRKRDEGKLGLFDSMTVRVFSEKELRRSEYGRVEKEAREWPPRTYICSSWTGRGSTRTLGRRG